MSTNLRRLRRVDACGRGRQPRRQGERLPGRLIPPRRAIACARAAAGFRAGCRVPNLEFRGCAMQAKAMLRLGYGLVPIVAGADKFTNLLTDWEKYLSPEVERRIPVDGRTFMRLVGLVEIAAGLL